MRVFWSVMLTGGLFLVGLDVYSRRAERATDAKHPAAIATMEDGSPIPPPNPPR